MTLHSRPLSPCDCSCILCVRTRRTTLLSRFRLFRERLSDRWSGDKMSNSPRSFQTSPLAPHLILSEPHTPTLPPSLAKHKMAPHEIRWGFISTGGIAQRFLAVRILRLTCLVMGMRARADHDASATAGLALGPSGVRFSPLPLPSLASLTSEFVHSQSLVAWQTRRRRRGPQGRRRRLPLASQSASVRRLPPGRQRARGGEGVRVLRRALCGSCALSLHLWMASLIKMGSSSSFRVRGNVRKSTSSTSPRPTRNTSPTFAQPSSPGKTFSARNPSCSRVLRLESW